MSPKKYTLMIIPDDDSSSRSYYFSKSKVYSIFFLCIFFISASFFIGFFSIKNLSSYYNLKNQHDSFSKERLRVLELTQDLNRIKQMDGLIRKSLGSSLKIDSLKPVLDTSANGFQGLNAEISYLDNIPSHAPVSGYISQRSGSEGFFITKSHNGIDIVAKEEEPVMAAASGVVVFSGWTYEFGNQVILYHGDNYFTFYGHNKQNFKKQRELVGRGEVIGLVGSTGVSSGPHLHFEVWKKFEPIDPLIYFPEYSKMDLTSVNE
jgi:murein DD-endopeptidase MepM/ murein hydrolase activator NlpD